MINQRKVDYLRVCFMIAGHTKFAPDRLFAQVSNSYNQQDVFTVMELKNLCDLHAQTVIEDGSSVFTWRDTLGSKYSDLPGTRKLHDFLTVYSYRGSLVMKVRENCYDDSFRSSPLRVINPDAEGVPTSNYKDTRLRQQVRTYEDHVQSLRTS